jgi:hypothetical protein
VVEPGFGVWTPCLHYHNKHFYIFWGGPDVSSYQISASTPTGPWTAPVLVMAGKGLVDPAPFLGCRWQGLPGAWLGRPPGRRQPPARTPTWTGFASIGEHAQRRLALQAQTMNEVLPGFSTVEKPPVSGAAYPNTKATIARAARAKTGRKLSGAAMATRQDKLNTLFWPLDI